MCPVLPKVLAGATPPQVCISVLASHLHDIGAVTSPSTRHCCCTLAKLIHAHHLRSNLGDCKRIFFVRSHLVSLTLSYW